MNRTTRLILILIPLLILAFAFWQLANVMAYIIIAFVISMVGQPLVSLLGRIKIGKWRLPIWLRSFVTLMLIWVVLFSFFRTFIPLLTQELQYFSNLELNSVWSSLQEPIATVENLVNQYNLSVDEQFSFNEWANETITDIVGIERITDSVKGIAGAIGNIFVAFAVISFTAFFFMKEARLFENGVVLFFPEEQEKKIINAIHSISRFMKRYFIGVSLQITGIITLNTIGLSIVGLNFSTAMTIAFVSGIINVIPYIGPLIALVVGLFIGTAVSIPADFYTEIIPLLIYITIAMEFTQIIDNVVFQPFIFSKSVKAHPLEIFLVIISAGTLGGVVGMILAVPTYTVIRVVAKEFLTGSSFVQKLTARM